MANKKIAELLKIALADSYILYLKTQNYHWNVTGTHFKSLHLMFEDQYNDLFKAVDLIAERIRALGEKAPGSFAKYSKVTNIKEGDEDLDDMSMVKDLAHDQDIIVETLMNILHKAQEHDDEVTAGIVTDRIEIHQKNAWMLKSSL
ncbi:MAG: DNA starvation/stationary phase protection protein [Rickettsiales bacterium]|nr:DNA starvation/stationary phase protection protein [Rickettsiales bacterium]